MNTQPLQIQRIDTRGQDVRATLSALRRKLSPRGDVLSEASRRRTIEVFGEPLTPRQVVQRICGDVRERGLDAVLEYCQSIDKAELTSDTLRVPQEELAAAHAAADPALLATIARIEANITEFQSAVLHQSVRCERPHQGYLEQRYVPLDRVGLCVPGGAAAYPSTVLMTAVPARVAGVRELVVVAPPTKFGSYNRDLLATCHALGISEVYRMGGAQAVAALAYGVEGVGRVDKIVGPGNLFVALAKQHVFGDVDIDSIAGPSEVIVIGDATARADYVAADLIAQAEHAPGSAVLVSWSDELLDAVVDELERQLAIYERGDLARESLEGYGALIRVRDAAEAAQVTDEMAPEHLHIATERPEALLAQIPHAGAVFLGQFTPVALGDYVAGPSHVLPTGGTARFASGLCANDFLRSHSVIHFSQTGMAAVAPDVALLAEKEGLTAHRASVDIRLPETPTKE